MDGYLSLSVTTRAEKVELFPVTFPLYYYIFLFARFPLSIYSKAREGEREKQS